MKQVIQTKDAPKAIGTYSQAIKVGNTVYLSGQIPLIPETMEMQQGDIEAQISRVFDNIKALAEAAGGTLADIVKVNVYLIDLNHFTSVNEIMTQYFQAPYPARAVVQVSKLPKGAAVEVDAVMAF